MIALPKLFAGNKVNPNVFRAALTRFFRRASPVRSTELPPQRRKILFESLEPRVLMSADFMPVSPVGTLIHHASESGALETAGAVAPYTFSLDAGQKISVVFGTEDADLRGTLELYDVTGGGETLLASASAAAPGEMALLDSQALAGAGDFRLDVRNLAGDGVFNVDMFLNATVELEQVGGAGNNDIASAQDLAPSEIALPGGGLRYAAVGTTETGEEDFYRIDLAQDESMSVGLASMLPGAGSDLRLELLDDAGTLIALGDATWGNFDQFISGFRAPAAGTYLLKVSGHGGEEYALVALRNALLEHEPNGLPERAQELGLMTEVLGDLGSKGASGQIKVAVVSTPAGGSYNAGLQAIVNQLNDDTWFDFTASLITPAQADTLQELQQYDVVVVGGARSSTNEFSAYASALRSYVEAGGGLVTTGWAMYSAQGLTGQARTDFDAVVPVYVGGSSDSYQYNSQFVPTGSHPVLDGVSSFYTGTYTQYPTGTPKLDVGATLLANVGSEVAAAAADIGNGRSVYLGPIYAGYSSSWNTVALRSGMADRLLEQAVNWAAFGGQDLADHYAFSASEGDALSLSITLPGDGASEPDNTLDPLVELFRPDGTLVASNEDGVGGRLATFDYAVQTGEAGQFQVRLTPVSGLGDYVLNVAGATGATNAAPEVVASSLADDAMLTSPPASLRFDFSEAIDLTSVDLSDLALLGPAGPVLANSVQVVDANTLNFDIAGLIDQDGPYLVGLGGISDLAGAAMTPHAQMFTLDTTGPSVVDVTNAAEPGDVTVVFTFDQALDEGALSVYAAYLYDPITDDGFTPVDYVYDDAGHTLSFDFEAVPEGEYELQLYSYYIRDPLGNELIGGDHYSGLTVDNVAGRAFPTPLDALSPLGSLIHDGAVTGAFNGDGDIDDFTLELDPDQILGVGLFPMGATFRGGIEVLDPSGSSLGYYEAGDFGALAALNTLPVSQAGTYVIRVSSLEGAGNYEVRLLLNAAAEEESLGGANNGQMADAQNIDASVIHLDGADRIAVSGTLETPHYSGDQPMLLGTLGRGGSASTLVELDPLSGTVTRVIGSVGYSVNGLEYDAFSGILYGTVSQNDSTAPSHLIEIDMNTGAGTPIGTGAGVGTLVNLTSDSMGHLYAWTESDDDLVSIDPVTGLGSVVGESGLSTATHGLAFDAADRLYFVNDDGNFYLVDPDTGATSYQFGLGQTAHHGDFDQIGRASCRERV